MTSTSVSIRDLTIDGGGGTHEGLFLLGLDGWNNQTDMRREKNDREQAHGVFPAPGFHDQRLIVVDGECLTSSPEQQDWWSKRLSGLLNEGEYGRLVIDHQGTTLWADVGLYTQSWDIDIYGERAEFQLQFLAPDPRRYGETHTFGPVGEDVEVAVWHYGNAKAYPRFTVDGNLDSGWAVYGPGPLENRKRFKVNGTVVSGTPNAIDLKTGLVKVGGNQRRNVIEDATTWGVPGGQQVNHLLDSNGDGGSLFISITDTYS